MRGVSIKKHKTTKLKDCSVLPDLISRLDAYNRMKDILSEI